MSHMMKEQETGHKTGHDDLQLDRRSVVKGGGLLVAAAAGGTFAPTVKASTRAKAVLSASDPVVSDVVLNDLDFSVAGANLGTQLGEVCCGFEDGAGNFALARATSVNPNQLLGSIVAIPPGMTEGNFKMMLGVGTDAMPANVPTGFTVTEPTLVWTTEEEIGATSSQTISLAAALQEQEKRLKMTVTNHWGSITMNDQVLVDISSAGPDCFPDDVIKFVSDMQLSNGEWLRFDIQGPLKVLSKRRLDLCIGDYCDFVEMAINDFSNGDLELICTTQGTFPTVQFLMQAVIDHRPADPITHTFVAGSALIQITRNP